MDPGCVLLAVVNGVNGKTILSVTNEHTRRLVRTFNPFNLSVITFYSFVDIAIPHLVSYGTSCTL